MRLRPDTAESARRGAGADAGRATRGASVDSSRSAEPVLRSAPTRIVLADPDPYLAFLLELNVPGVRVFEAGSDDELRALLAERTDLVIVDLGSARAQRLVRLPDRPTILGITADVNASTATVPVDGVLVRPFVPAELAEAVRAALGFPAPARVEHVAPTRVRTLIGAARLAAVSLAAVLEVGGAGLGSGRAMILAAAFVYASGRFLIRAHGRIGAVVDVAAAATVLALTGGPASAYWPLGLVAAAIAGLTMGSYAGALGGTVISLVSVGEVFRVSPDQPSQTLAWFLIFAVTGVAGGLGARIWHVDEEGSHVLEEANRVLSTLHHIARAVPGSLDLRTVVGASLEEIRDAVGAPAAAVLLEEAGTCRVFESFGLADPDGLAVSPGHAGLSIALREGVRVLLRSEMLPSNAAAVGEHDCWLAAPLKHGSARFGLLVAACPNHLQHHRNRLLLERLAEETAVAVENAQLFRNVRELSIDEERRRLAREIHDGVAQALMHVKLELDFMARHGTVNAQAVKQETQRLARVVDRAIADVRAMILGLRVSVSTEGLAGAIRSYLRDLRGLGGPEITFLSRGAALLTPDTEAEIFRIVQEALSNSLRHAQAKSIAVLLDCTASGVLLRIEDDGRGFWPKPDGNGVGLTTMQERAERLGARLSVGSRVGGGTQVELFCPAGPSEQPRPKDSETAMTTEDQTA